MTEPEPEMPSPVVPSAALFGMQQDRFGLIGAREPVEPSVSIYSWREQGITVWELRGRKMRKYETLMDEVGAVFQFPSYFGENWPALSECLCDLDWFPTWPTSMVFVVHDAEQVLTKSKDLDVFARILLRAVEEYAQPVSVGEYWDRDPIPTRVVLSTSDPAKTIKRWSAAGASIEHLA